MTPSRAILGQLSVDQGRSALPHVDIILEGVDTMVVTPTGEADLSTAPDLRQALHATVAAGYPHVIVDLNRLTFMDASTLGVLVDAQLRMSATGGTFKVRCRSTLGRRLLTMTGLDFMLDEGSLLAG